MGNKSQYMMKKGGPYSLNTQIKIGDIIIRVQIKIGSQIYYRVGPLISPYIKNTKYEVYKFVCLFW